MTNLGLSEATEHAQMLKSVKQITTDVDGRLPQDTRLRPDTAYTICIDWNPSFARRVESPPKLAKWITDCVLGDLRTLRLGIETKDRITVVAKDKPLGGGNFLLAAGCCTALEYMAWIYVGGGDALSNVRRFLADFMSPIDKRYIEFMDLLWRSYRNGIIHGSWPQHICIEGNEDDQIVAGANTSLDGDHLAPSGRKDYPSLEISSVRFLEDVERAVYEGFVPWILKNADDQVLDRAGPRLLVVSRGDGAGVKQVHRLQALHASQSKPVSRVTDRLS